MSDCCYNLLMRKIPAVLALLVLFASCATTGRDGPGPVYVTDAKKVSVLPARYMDGKLEAVQFFSGSFGDRSFSSLVSIQADGAGLSMTLLNDFGMDMGTLAYSDGSLSFSSPYFPEELRAEYILLDFQNAYYDFAALKKAYASAGLSFCSDRSDGKDVRQLKDGDVVIEEIVREGGDVTIINLLRGYRYELRTIEG